MEQKDKIDQTKNEVKIKKKSLSLFTIIIIVVVLYFLFRPSEEDLCNDATIEAKAYVWDYEYDLNDWVIYEYDLQNEEVSYFTIGNTDCNLWERNDIEVTLELDVRTSKNRHIPVEAVVSVTDGYADNIEFQYP